MSSARLGILTNGREIWFFSDIDKLNKMDDKPFFVFDLQSFDDLQLVELARFQKDNFDIDAILAAAARLGRVKETANYLREQMSNPDDEFVKVVGRAVHDRPMTKPVIEDLRPCIKAAFEEILKSRLQAVVKSGFEALSDPVAEPPAPAESASEGAVETTDEERFAFMVVQAIVGGTLPLERLYLRDAKSYCAVLVDDNNRKPLCRFYFNAKPVKHLGILGADKVETSFKISSPIEIHQHAELLVSAARSYLSSG